MSYVVQLEGQQQKKITRAKARAKTTEQLLVGGHLCSPECHTLHFVRFREQQQLKFWRKFSVIANQS